MFHEHLWSYFRSLRDIKRFCSSFEFYYRRHLNDGVLEVDVIDLISIEILRMFDNKAYKKISRSIVFARTSILDFYANEREFREKFQLSIDAVANHLEDKERRDSLKRLLNKLFPQASDTGFHENAQQEWHRHARICDEKSFYRYFELNLDSKQATQKDLAELLSFANDRVKTVKLLRSSIEDGVIESLLTLLLYAKDDISLDSMQALTTALFDVGDELPNQSEEWHTSNCNMVCNKIIFHRLKSEDQNVVGDLLLRAHTDTTGFELPIHHLALEDENYRKEGKRTPDEFLISDEDLPKYYEINLARIRAKAEDLSLIEHRECSYVLGRWADWERRSEAREWVTKVAKDPQRAIKLLIGFLSESQSTDGTKVRIEPFLGAKWMEKFVDLEALLLSAKKVPESDRPERSEEAIELLEIAVELKNSGKSYEHVRPRNSRFY